jgi:DNA-binding protein HU-beta
MTKAELVVVMAKASGGSKSAAERAVNSFLASVIDSLRRGRKVTISGFGTFVVTRRAARNGRNPRTGSAIKIPPAKVPKFRPSRSLRSDVR